MRLTFLGTGSAMPAGRAQSGTLLETDDDTLLVDCGSGVLNALSATEAGYESVDTVLLTHHHLDHVSDLMPLLKARWLAGEEDLTIVGPDGTESLVADLLDAHEYMQDRLDLAVRDIEPTPASDPHEIATFQVAAMETRHSMDCLAYRFESPDEAGPITFSGDSEAFTDLVEFADGSAVFAHDCSFPDDVDVSNHPTPESLGRVLADAGAELGRVYLTHFYPHTDGKHEEMLESIGTRYDGDVRIARDGLSVDVSEN